MTNVLDVKMKRNDAKAKTVRDYLKKLLERLWDEGESFCGKRPFGNSDWEYDLYDALVRAELVEGAIFAGDVEITAKGREQANKLIFAAIKQLT